MAVRGSSEIPYSSRQSGVPADGSIVKAFEAAVPYYQPSSPDSNKLNVSTPKTEFIDLEKTEKHPENLETLDNIRQSVGKVFDFAKRHPFLTAGFVLGLAAIGTALPSLIGSFVTSHIQLLNTDFVLGAGLAMMSLYYGVLLINLARQGASKDQLEQVIDQARDAANALLTKNRELAEQEQKNFLGDVETLGKRATHKLDTFKTQLNQQLEGRIDSHSQLQTTIANQLESVQQLITQNVFKDRPDLQEQAQGLLSKMSQEIQRGATLLSDSATLYSVDEIEIPEYLTQEQQNNKKIEESITRALEELYESIHIPSFSEIGQFIKGHPFSSLAMFAGFSFALLAIPVAVLSAHGVTFFQGLGTISIESAAQFFLFGVLLIFGGYSGSKINKLNEQIAKIQKEIDLVHAVGSAAVEEFHNYVNKLQALALSLHGKKIEEIAQKDQIYLRFINDYHRLLEAQMGLSPAQLPSHEQLNQTFSHLQEGARSAASKTIEAKH